MRRPAALKRNGVRHHRLRFDLRHSFVSLLIHEGRSVVDVAQQAGHAPTMTLSTYAHVFAEFGHEDRKPAEEQIRRARDGIVYPFRTSSALTAPMAQPLVRLNRNAIQQALHRTRTDDPFLTIAALMADERGWEDTIVHETPAKADDSPFRWRAM